MYSEFAIQKELIRFSSLNRLDGVTSLAFELDFKWILKYFVVWPIPVNQHCLRVKGHQTEKPNNVDRDGITSSETFGRRMITLAKHNHSKIPRK